MLNFVPSAIDVARVGACMRLFDHDYKKNILKHYKLQCINIDSKLN